MWIYVCDCDYMLTNKGVWSKLAKMIKSLKSKGVTTFTRLSPFRGDRGGGV